MAYDALSQGAGALNAGGAITLAGAIDTRAPNGATWVTTSVTPETTVGAEVLPWAQHIVWGEAVYVNAEAWRQNIVWGNAANIVWGNLFETLGPTLPDGN